MITIGILFSFLARKARNVFGSAEWKLVCCFKNNKRGGISRGIILRAVKLDELREWTLYLLKVYLVTIVMDGLIARPWHNIEIDGSANREEEEEGEKSSFLLNSTLFPFANEDTKGVSYLDSSSPQGASSRFNFQKDRRAKTTDDLSTLGYSVQLKRLLRLFPLRGVNWSDLALNRVSRENCLGPISRAISSARQRVNQTKVYLNLNSRESVNFRVLTRGKTRDSFEINRVQLVVESSLVSLTA